ncbi:hypothetical protein ACWTQY_27460, partial [Klebsiella pneumoniae]
MAAISLKSAFRKDSHLNSRSFSIDIAGRRMGLFCPSFAALPADMPQIVNSRANLHNKMQMRFVTINLCQAVEDQMQLVHPPLTLVAVTISALLAGPVLAAPMSNAQGAVADETLT